MATATSELSDEIADPTPMRALRRISHIASPVNAVSRDGLLLRAARYVALAPLVYRILAVPGAMAVFLTAHGGTGAVPVVLVTVCSVALHVYGTAWLLRSAPFRSDRAARHLMLDAVFTMASGLAVAATVPSVVFLDAMLVPNKQLFGSVALLTLAVGVPCGVGLALASLPLRVAGTWLNSGRGRTWVAHWPGTAQCPVCCSRPAGRWCSPALAPDWRWPTASATAARRAGAAAPDAARHRLADTGSDLAVRCRRSRTPAGGNTRTGQGAGHGVAPRY